VTENQRRKSSSQFNWWRVIHVDESNVAFLGLYHVGSLDEIVTSVKKYCPDIKAIIAWRVDYGEEATRKDHKLVEQIQKIHKEFAQDKAKLVQEASRSTLGHGKGRCYLLFDEQVP
jgi:hypothetical protein